MSGFFFYLALASLKIHFSLFCIKILKKVLILSILCLCCHLLRRSLDFLCYSLLLTRSISSIHACHELLISFVIILYLLLHASPYSTHHNSLYTFLFSYWLPQGLFSNLSNGSNHSILHFNLHYRIVQHNRICTSKITYFGDKINFCINMLCDKNEDKNASSPACDKVFVA